ncbi:MAG: AAA family ATPase [Acetatifactor sp.]|nr:AAA family ATPase [Acetatifactor sp.]
MIDKIQLVNYRCFENAKINFKSISIIVGKNNSGKSSLLEALRLVALAIRKSTHTTYREIPTEFQAPVRDKGFRLDVEKIKIDLRGIVYLYEDKNAQIVVVMESGVKIVIHANSEYAYAVLYDEDGRNIKNKMKAQVLNIERVEILPQIGLIKETEKRLSDQTIDGDRDTYLSSRHFRNEILKYHSEFWNEFVQLAEETWEELKIKSIEYDIADEGSINLYVSDANFLAEIGLMGSGLQMWLQIMWFLTRTKGASTVILDEPDVYMHPDLQRKLLKIVKKRYTQTIVATHSVEIISETEATNILMVDKKKRRMAYATDLKAVQKIIDDIGAVNNIALTRIGSYRKCVFVEGDDLKLLDKMANKIYPNKTESLMALPSVALGGFNNLREAFGAAKLFYDETGGMIKCYCILDKDYFSQDKLDELRKEANSNHLQLHIWSKKEIENYLLNPRVLFRIIASQKVLYQEFLEKLQDLLDSMQDEVFDQMSGQIAKYNSMEHSTANKVARKVMSEKWTTLENKLSLVGGKAFIKKINHWFQTTYKVSCSQTKILDNFTAEDFDSEIKDVLAELLGY